MSKIFLKLRLENRKWKTTKEETAGKLFGYLNMLWGKIQGISEGRERNLGIPGFNGVQKV